MTVHSIDVSSINRLCSDALKSSAVNHPYLHAISQGDFPNFTLVIQDFAYQYGVYSKLFTHYLNAVIDNLNSAQHKALLLENLTEEQGDTHDVVLPPEVLASIEGVPHAQLYRRFQDAVGIDADYMATVKPSETAQLWRDQFLALCQLDECVGIGAIGIGTELIVSSIYSQILEGLKSHSDLSMIERVFFDLHSQCDDEHAAQMRSIANDLAVDSRACERIEYGAKMALQMRTIFWDKMYERALHFSSATATNVERLTLA